MTSLGSAVQAAIRRGRTSGSYLGTVTAINAVEFALTIDIGTGTPLVGVRWIGSYTPAVNDFVTVVRFGPAWVVLGKLSKNLTGAGFTETSVTVRPIAGRWGIARARYWSSPSGWGPWSVEQSEVEAYRQGRYSLMGNDGSWGEEYWHASGGDFGSALTTAIPSGSTVSTASIRMTRSADASGAGLVAPVLYGLTAAEANLIARDYTWPSLGPSSGPWRPGSLAATGTGIWPLPSTWITNLLSGTWRSLMVMSSADADLTNFAWDASLEVIITYRTPV